jgi:hypothetical protein
MDVFISISTIFDHEILVHKGIYAANVRKNIKYPYHFARKLQHKDLQCALYKS